MGLDKNTSALTDLGQFKTYFPAVIYYRELYREHIGVEKK
jgi:hypothetical protein